MIPQLVLASTSPYRRELLDRLGLAYRVARPDVDEAREPGESPPAMAARLAEAKARAVAGDFPEAWTIGADQVAVLRDGGDEPLRILGKPGSHAAAVAQLRLIAGRQVDYFTGLALCHGGSGRCHTVVVPCQVTLRPLSDAEIERYLLRDQPYNCAGSFKSEGLGIALFDAIISDDPTALIGLPLIALRMLLQRENLELF